MDNKKKVTYTLDQRIINIIENRSYLSDQSQSRWLSNCIQLGFQMMVDDYNENDKQPLVGAKRKRPNTIPKTFTLPMDVITTLNWFSEKLVMKKSHLVIGCVLNFEKMESEKLSQQIKELMDSVEDSY
jgi:hypothetical protein